MARLILITLFLGTLIIGCKNEDSYQVDTTEELGQQIGEIVASIDESSGELNGSIARYDIKSEQKSFNRFMKFNKTSSPSSLASLFYPEAYAAACSTVTFDACGSSFQNSRVRNFNSCTLDFGAVISGNVRLTYSGSNEANCTIPSTSDSVSRTPDFTISGVRGATFEVSSVGLGQTLTRTGVNSFSYSNSGISRSFTTPKGITLLYLTVATQSDLTFTGNSRSGRQITGGTLEIENNINSRVCTITPDSVTWGNANCNCPTSGSFTGTCSTGESLDMVFSSTCGNANLTLGTEVKAISLDRCTL